MRAKTGILFLCLIFVSLPAFAQKGAGGGPGFDFRRKAESKEGKRWTLQEWLDQRDRNYMMDLWLGMYAPSPYEFFISGTYQSYDTKPSQDSFRSYAGSLGAYALVMGLQAEYENNVQENYNDLAGSLNLRVLGNAVQGTHLIFHYGLRTRHLPNNVTLGQQFAGADLNLYVMKYFGLQGLYRVYLPTSSDTLGEVGGSRTEAGAFIDFGALRIFGRWFNERQEAKQIGATEQTEKIGIQSGLQFFF